MPRLHSYVVEHDYGFAPNPFWRICTVANCKPKIRAKAEIGDIVIGTGSASADLSGHLIFWMRVNDILNFDEYWENPRFSSKKPIMNGSRMQRFGDNIYHTDTGGKIHQLDSFHSEEGGIVSTGNLERDTGTTNRVLIGIEYAYFGKSAPAIPDHLRYVVKKGPGHKNRFAAEFITEIEAWLTSQPARGCIGEPVRW